MKVGLKDYLTTLYVYFNILVPVLCIFYYFVQLIINYITNCNWQTCVIWQGTNYELPEDDTVVSKHVEGVW